MAYKKFKKTMAGTMFRSRNRAFKGRRFKKSAALGTSVMKSIRLANSITGPMGYAMCSGWMQVKNGLVLNGNSQTNLFATQSLTQLIRATPDFGNQSVLWMNWMPISIILKISMRPVFYSDPAMRPIGPLQLCYQ